MNDDPTLYALIHIPKAAGKTVRWIALRQFGKDTELKLPKERWRKPLATELASRPVSLVTDVPMVFTARDQIQRPVRYLTMLRHPVARVLSFYRYLQPDGDFSDFKISRAVGNNAMVRALVGCKWVKEPVTPTMVQQAKAHLDAHFAWVGTVERFDESILLAKHLLGWRKILYQSRNVSIGKSRSVQPPAWVIEAITQDNRHDIALYAYVDFWLGQQIVARGEEFQLELEAYRRLLASERGDSLGGGTHEAPPKLPRQAYRRHVKAIVNAYHAENPKGNWRAVRVFAQEIAADHR